MGHCREDRQKRGKVAETPESLRIASEGIRTSCDALAFTASLIGDVMTGKVGTTIAGVAVRTLLANIRVRETERRLGKLFCLGCSDYQDSDG